MSAVKDRFIRYARIDTQGNEVTDETPTNENEMLLAELIREELLEIGLEDIHVDEHAFLYARLESNTDKAAPAIAFLAHMDTTPEIPGEKIRIQSVPDYDGSDIVLNRRRGVILSPEEYPELNRYIGDEILTSDGTTVLGAEGKAGIAEIVEAVRYLCEHPEIRHGEVYFCFTPDEEISREDDRYPINIRRIPAKYGYTVDEGGIGEFNYENFNAATAEVRLQGVLVHPGRAKGTMINANYLAGELLQRLTRFEVPENTEGYEGYYYVESIVGNTQESRVTIRIRDFDAEGLRKRKDCVREIAEAMNRRYGEGTVTVEMQDTYRNIAEKVREYPELIENAMKAIEQAGLEARIVPIRGATYGSVLSFMGLPCPNIFSGCHNEHSIREFISVRAMEKAVEVIVNIIRLFAE